MLNLFTFTPLVLLMGFEPIRNKVWACRVCHSTTAAHIKITLLMAVAVGFEPTVLLYTAVFKTATINRSDTLPFWRGGWDLNPRMRKLSPKRLAISPLKPLEYRHRVGTNIIY